MCVQKESLPKEIRKSWKEIRKSRKEIQRIHPLEKYTNARPNRQALLVQLACKNYSIAAGSNNTIPYKILHSLP
jgi:hypothetical protein